MTDSSEFSPFNGFNLPGKDYGMVDNRCHKDLCRQKRCLSVSQCCFSSAANPSTPSDVVSFNHSYLLHYFSENLSPRQITKVANQGRIRQVIGQNSEVQWRNGGIEWPRLGPIIQGPPRQRYSQSASRSWPAVLSGWRISDGTLFVVFVYASLQSSQWRE